MKRLLLALLAITLLVPLASFTGRTNPIPHTQGALVRITGHLVQEEYEDNDLVARQAGTPNYTCTGFVVAPTTILTANHCVGKEMRGDGQPLFVIRTSPDLDLALLAGQTRGKTILTLRTDPLHRGDDLLGMGYGFAFQQPTITYNKVMLLDYSPTPDLAPGIFVFGAFIPGMSGGPVVDQAGAVAMIVQRVNAAIGYGVDANTIRAFLN